jgi:hypothetical protein
MDRFQFLQKYGPPYLYHTSASYCCGLREINLQSIENYVLTNRQDRRTLEYFLDLLQFYITNSENRQYAGGYLTDTSKSRRIHRWLTKISGEPIKLGKNHNYSGATIYMWTITHAQINKCRDAEKNKTTTKKTTNKVSSKR